MRDETLRVAVVKAFGNAVKSAKSDSDAALLEAAEREGVRRMVAMLPDGTQVADVTIAVPQPKATVVNHAAFLAWVKEHEPRAVVPEATVTVVQAEHVDPEYAEQMLAEFVNNGGDAFTRDGEAVEGVAFTQGKPYPSVKFRSGGERLTLGAALTTPMLALGGSDE